MFEIRQTIKIVLIAITDFQKFSTPCRKSVVKLVSKFRVSELKIIGFYETIPAKIDEFQHFKVFLYFAGWIDCVKISRYYVIAKKCLKYINFGGIILCRYIDRSQSTIPENVMTENKHLWKINTSFCYAQNLKHLKNHVTNYFPIHT